MPGTRKLGKTSDQRMAMLRQQVTDFLDNGKMETTVTRAKEIKPVAEKMITLGKKGDLAAYRQAMSFITSEDVCKKLFKEIAHGYAERNRRKTTMPGTRKLGKTTDQRMAMLRQQVTDFLDNGRMETTITRAKEIQPMSEKMITLGKKGDLAAYRQALSLRVPGISVSSL